MEMGDFMNINKKVKSYKPKMLLLLIMIMLSCQTINFADSSEPTISQTLTQTNFPTETFVPNSTQSPTIASTPTLGLKSDWRLSRIAFSSNRSGSYQIYLMRPDGSELTQYTNNEGDNFEPAWSLDARIIAFVSTQDGNFEIYTMNPDGTEQINITSNPAKDYMPVWMPKGKIAFVSDRDGDERIYVMESDGTNVQPMHSTAIDSSEQFFCLVWIGEGLVSFSITRETKDRLVRIVDTATNDSFTPDGLNDTYDRSCPIFPTFIGNPWFVFISNKNGNDQIYKYDFDRDIEEQVTTGPSSNIGTSRSSDESWIVFYSEISGNHDIFLTKTKGIGTDIWNITNNPADDIQPAWEPY